MNESIAFGNNDKGARYMINDGNLIMNGIEKVCPLRKNNPPCGTDCMHLNIHADSVNPFAIMTCTGINVRFRLIVR
jgi:hypothetical protein